MDSALLTGILSAGVALLVAILLDRREKAKVAREAEVAEGHDAVALRIREIDAVEEFRDVLRETVKEQGERIGRLELELERARIARLQHERERLEWHRERLELESRLNALELLLANNGIEIDHSQLRTRSGDK